MTTIHDLSTPALLLDLEKLDTNLSNMVEKAERLGVSLRPHIKTHKCVEIARRQAGLGGRGITVSTLEEALVFADHGFDDLTWAFPVILSRIDEARVLAERINLRLVVDSPEAIEALESSEHPFHVWLKIDCGYHRAGVDPASNSAIELARRLHDSPILRFNGLLTHSGHAYKGRSRQEIRQVAEQERRLMVILAQRLRLQQIEVPCLSVGSTPAMAQVESLDGIDEIRPGNYAFYDYMQVTLGSCSVADCAVTVLSSVISSQPGADHCVVDAGALALSKDAGLDTAPRPTMGETFEDYEASRLSDRHRLTSLSQEHGILSGSLPLGEHVRILPNHSCLTAACFDSYAVHQGNDVINSWRIRRAR